MVKLRKDSSLSIRMPLVLQEQIKPAVKVAKAKNQTVFLTSALATLLKQIHNGAPISDLMVDQCSLGWPSSMINVRITPMVLNIINSTSTRFYQATTHTVMWATALAIQRQGLHLDIAKYTSELPSRISIPEEIRLLIDRSAHKLKIDPELYPRCATEVLVKYIKENRPIRQLALPRGVWLRTSRNVPVRNPQYRKLSLDPELADDVLCLAPRLYHSPSTFVLWASCWVGFRVTKIS